ncbi:phosphoribosyl-ATP pyrophosphohydrolase [bacterium]|nr:phosphoribosyl-ATP pyrophosphohydrolase [bacterium]
MKKLVRDKIVDNILKEGGKVDSNTLNDEQFVEELKKKLQEELDELMKVKYCDKKNLINEISDIQLLINYLLKVLEISKEELDKKQAEKAIKAGSFDKRIFVETVTLQNNDEWIEYYQEKGFEEVI